MRPELPADACWTSLIGAPVHRLGELPEKCLTCAAKQREDLKALGRLRERFGSELTVFDREQEAQ